MPIDGSKPSGEDIQVAYTKDQVKDAPGVDPDGELSQSEERELWTHYGLEYGEDHGHDHDQVDTRTHAPAPATTPRGPDTDDAMTRSEEEVCGRHPHARRPAEPGCASTSSPSR